MSTQGVLSIVRGDKVVVKLVTGCDGYFIHDVAKALNESLTVNPHNIMRMAKECGLGGSSLIVQWTPGDYICDGPMEKLPDLYAKKFNDPTFNPRGSRGTAAHTVLIRVQSKQQQ